MAIEIDADSIDTRESQRDAHLKSADFFEVEKYPTMTFKSTKVEAAGKGKYKVTGDLTLHGVTKPVALKVAFSPNAGGARLSVTGTMKRLDFGVGSGEYKDTSTIADDVLVNGSLNLLPK